MIERPRSAAPADLHAMVETYLETSFGTDNVLVTEAIRRMLAAGGKRLRPRLTLLAAEAVGGDAREHLALAAYMELIHVATLIHDDVVDRADTRRGINATAVDFGNRVSVLAGDYLFAWIFRNVTADYPAPVPHILSATLAEICDGEVLQLQSLGNLSLSVNGYVDIVRRKTASLFAASAECGAIMGGGPSLRVKALRDFGLYYGIAFQMLDDLLDATASEAEIGKPVGNDLRERKVTIPVILARDAAGPDLLRALERFYAGGQAGEDGVADALAGILGAGAATLTREAIAGYVERAKQSLAPLGNAAARASLADLADALVPAESVVRR